MIIMMNTTSPDSIQRVVEKLKQHSLDAYCVTSNGKTLITAVGDSAAHDSDLYERMSGVEKVVNILTPFKLVSRELKADDSLVHVRHVVFGSPLIPVIAGPCAVESPEQFLETAQLVKAAGASMLRGGAYKPRTSPYSFQGLELEGLKILRTVSEQVDMPVVSEVTDPRTVELTLNYVDMLQIGARNMQNFALLKEVAKTDKPILLKRGLSATVEEWLMAAEYIMAGGNEKIVLCERGIRTFETYTRNTLDLNAIPLVKHLSHLPIIVDPSHGTGNWRLVTPMARAGVASGADGLIVEVHPCPEEAVSDGPQSLIPQNFTQLMTELSKIAAAIDRSV
ncbi:3-deoxy-7-phosphoheptulonate synthase [Azotosporobacter soli]|uniref:3-deoxy-7-phosphoheptulonate synthase n=1 Tax=Azotosporobacter soli TaxID=3055040 RepID=UPI0031FE440F